MSGTSADAVDAALVEIASGKLNLVAAESEPYNESLQDRLLNLNKTSSVTLTDLIVLNNEIATAFANAAMKLVRGPATDKNIVAIGSHGQTVFHQPEGPYPGTLQLGNSAVIAQHTGIDTISDFRSADMACGGQGAPLTPAFNQWAFQSNRPRAILNLGGIANVTFLEEGDTSGFDTGPANTLLDAWVKKQCNLSFDQAGNWARTGKCDNTLLTILLDDPFFTKSAPKSTGPDYFNLSWLTDKAEQLTAQLAPADVQATLVELTAVTAANAIIDHYPGGVEILLCGGGSHNGYLVERLRHRCLNCTVSDTERATGISVDHCESMAFAWLAYQYKAGLTGNLPAVTGASKKVVLGALYKA